MQQLSKTPWVCLITGPAGAGKSSVSKELAHKFEKSAVIDVDYLYNMIVGGRVKPWMNNEDSSLQLELARNNACILATNFLEKGFNVIINKVAGRKDLEHYANFFKDKNFKAFLLLPTLEALLDRFDKRGIDDELRKRTHELHELFMNKRDKLPWQVINSSDQTLEETTDQIYRELTK